MADEAPVRALYEQLLDRWNHRDAEGYAALFAETGHVIGFDGSMMDGRAAIAAALAPIFADHPTPEYVARITGVEFLAADVAMLRAAAGMVPRGQPDLDPALNAIQTLVAAGSAGRWRIVLFQNTPAAFHGRPHLVEQLSRELRQALRPGG
jgi:uncharacterized protein (TIGR02246 family)